MSDISAETEKASEDAARALAKSTDVKRRVESISDKIESETAEKLRQLQGLSAAEVDNTRQQGMLS